MITKLISLPLMLIFFTFHYSNAQSWVNTDNRWHIQLNCTGGGFGRSQVYGFFFRDSLTFNGKMYRQLYETLDSTFQDADSTGYWYREENDKVYIYEPQYSTPERLIYNFNLKVDDTLTIENGFSREQIKVVFVDSVTLMDGSKRKRLTITSNAPFTRDTAIWIEGIGSEVAPLDTKSMFISDCQESLNCFYLQNRWVYQRAFQSCTLYGDPVSVHDIPELADMKVFPNPFTTEFYLDAALLEGFKPPADYSIAVFDLQGKQMYHTEVAWVNDLRINTDTWRSGLYLLVIRSASGVLSRKLVKF